MTAILSSSNSSQYCRQPSGPIGKDLVLEEQTSFVPDSYNLLPVIWVGKEREAAWHQWRGEWKKMERTVRLQQLNS